MGRAGLWRGPWRLWAGVRGRVPGVRGADVLALPKVRFRGRVFAVPAAPGLAMTRHPRWVAAGKPRFTNNREDKQNEVGVSSEHAPSARSVAHIVATETNYCAGDKLDSTI